MVLAQISTIHYSQFTFPSPTFVTPEMISVLLFVGVFRAALEADSVSWRMAVSATGSRPLERRLLSEQQAHRGVNLQQALHVKCDIWNGANYWIRFCGRVKSIKKGLVYKKYTPEAHHCIAWKKGNHLQYVVGSVKHHLSGLSNCFALCFR